MHLLIRDGSGSLRESLQNSTDTSYVVESSFFLYFVLPTLQHFET